MKFFLPLLLFPFLCVKCCPWDDCPEEEPVCTVPESTPFSQLTLTSIPYSNGNQVNFLASDGTEIPAMTTRDEILGFDQSGNCEKRLEVSLQSTDEFNLINVRGVVRGDASGYRYVIIRGRTGFVVTVDIEINQGPENAGEFLVFQPGQRIVADTVLAGGEYENVLVSTFPSSEAYEAVYYTREKGFVQFDIITGARIFLRD